MALEKSGNENGVKSEKEKRQEVSKLLQELIECLRFFRLDFQHALPAPLDPLEKKGDSEKKGRWLTFFDEIVKECAHFSLDYLASNQDEVKLEQLKTKLEKTKNFMASFSKQTPYSRNKQDNTGTIGYVLSSLTHDDVLQSRGIESAGLHALFKTLFLEDEETIKAQQEIFASLDDTLFLFPYSSGVVMGSLWAEAMKKSGKAVHWKGIMVGADHSYLADDLQKYKKVIVLDDQVGMGGTLRGLKKSLESVAQDTRSEVTIKTMLDFRENNPKAKEPNWFT